LVNEVQCVTGFEAGLSGDEQIRIALQRIIERGGEARMTDIYDAVEDRLRPTGCSLSEQGRHSLRFFVNRVAVQAGYVYPHDRANPGWRITPEGREFVRSPAATEEVAVNVDTGVEERVVPNSVQGAAFERWVILLLRAAYPYYAWYDQGRHKLNERGLDFVGTRVGDSNDEARSIGVQVKLHQPNNAPTQGEWLKFLAGCFARRVESAMFVTTGRLTGEQRREAQEAKVIVIAGASEILRLAQLHNVEPFELVESRAEAESG
jgi:Restriction endonuclease